MLSGSTTSSAASEKLLLASLAMPFPFSSYATASMVPGTYFTL